MRSFKTGLVLEGGAMRGLFSAGVIDVMMEHGIDFDGLIGVSAGSSFGCNYKSRQPGRVLRYNLRFGRDPRYMGLRSLLSSGNLVGAQFAYHTLPLELDRFDIASFETNPMEFYAVCTDVATGLPVYYRMDRVDYQSLEWLRASASMPIVTRPVKVDDGRRMLDGGISDSIPLRYFQEIGYERNVVVLTQPRSFRKRPSPGWIWRLLMPLSPAIAKAMARRHEMYNAQLDYLSAQEALGNTLVIAPDEPLPIGRIDTEPDKMRRVYSLGKDAALRHMPKIISFLSDIQDYEHY
ncbi:MAG: patatin family protein [Pseudoflavonifractor sp.]|nr:patatin family protein [Alloprevotella sp.]MCM1117334.1 patatin family protein [Pseudoflavonifractor sp.]